MPSSPPNGASRPLSLDYRAILNQASDAMFVSDATSHITDVNAAACAMLGYTRDEMLRMVISDFVLPDVRADVARNIERLRAGQSIRADRQYVRKDRSLVHVEVTAVFAPPGFYLAIARETGERIRAERDRQRQTDLLDGQNRVLKMIAAAEPLDDTLDAIAQVVDDQHPESMASILIADPGGRTMTGKAAPRLPREVRDTFASVPVADNVGSCGTAAFRRQPVVVTDLVSDPKWAPWRDLVLRNGLRACWSTPVLSRAGELLGTFALYYPRPVGPDDHQRRLIDVAAKLVALAIEQHRDRDELLRSNQALRDVVDHAPIAIMVVAPDRRIAAWNPAAEQMFGYTADEAIGTTISDLMVPADRTAEHDDLWRRVHAGQQLGGLQLRRRRKDGSVVEISIWTSPLRGPGGASAGMLAFCADVTNQAQLQEQLLRAQRMESIGRLAGGISHEFNNLLAVISGYSEALLRRTTDDHPLREHAQEIHRAASRGAALTQQLLAFSRRQVAAPRVMDLARAVHGTYGMLRRVITDKIDIRLHADQPVMVRADPGQVEQVLVNLAINARDAMPEQGGSITIETRQADVAPGEVQGFPPGPAALLRVSDTGFGMDPRTASRIFEPFFTTKEAGQGTGLGLSIVYGIVQQAGGHIAVRSTPGQGSTFDILLPLVT